MEFQLPQETCEVSAGTTGKIVSSFAKRTVYPIRRSLSGLSQSRLPNRRRSVCSVCRTGQNHLVDINTTHFISTVCNRGQHRPFSAGIGLSRSPWRTRHKPARSCVIPTRVQSPLAEVFPAFSPWAVFFGAPVKGRSPNQSARWLFRAGIRDFSGPLRLAKVRLFCSRCDRDTCCESTRPGEFDQNGKSEACPVSLAHTSCVEPGPWDNPTGWLG